MYYAERNGLIKENLQMNLKEIHRKGVRKIVRTKKRNSRKTY